MNKSTQRLFKFKYSINEFIIVYGTGLLVTILSGIYFHICGYPKVVTATETLDIITSPIYMVSIFLPYGTLIGELIWIWLKRDDKKIFFLFFFECAIIGLLSFIRYLFGVPFSGHTLILSFYLLHYIASHKCKYPLRIISGIIVLFITIFYKLFLWNDPITFSIGILLGLVLWVPGFLYRMKYV
ncbi:MAG: hypothetical protein ACFFAN_12255 [Promethearchaeota archaeon]